MRNTISHGSADQMLDAFEQRIAILEDDQNLEVDSATTVQASRRSGFARGTADQMLDAFERKIDDLEDRDVNSSTSVQASIRRNKKHVEVISDAPASSDYIPTLVDAVNNELEDLNVFDSWTWDEEKDSMVLTTILDNDVQEYTIPKEDLKFNEAGLDRDVEYIMNAITSEDEPGDVTSCTAVQASSKAVSIPDHATDTYYKDVGGGFGEIDAIYSLEDIMIMWNSECDSDPCMEEYDSFKDWWKDTRTNFVRLHNAEDIEECTSVTASDYEEDSIYEKIESKQVPDYDGFYTDYTMYRNKETGEYVFVFGDNDLYSPEDSEHDYECETEDEAYEWFDSYTGFDDEDEGSEELTPEGFYKFFSSTVEPKIKDKAAKTLYGWYSNEGEEYMPEYSDILDMCDAADDEEDKRLVLQALGVKEEY